MGAHVLAARPALVGRVAFLGLLLAAAACVPAQKRQAGAADGRAPASTREAFAGLDGGGGPSRVTLLDDNRLAWAERWRLLESARDRIDVTYFIVETDVFGMSFLGHLYKKAVDGVQVRLLLDGRGSDGLLRPLNGKDHLQELVATGQVTVRVYNPPVKRAALGLFSADVAPAVVGTHNKIIVVDGARAITGGRNISQPYYASEAEDPQGFTDADVVVEGRAVAGIEAAMDRDHGVWSREDIRRDLINLRSRRDELLMVYGAMDAFLKGAVDAGDVDALEQAGAAATGTKPSAATRNAVRPHLEQLARLTSLHGALVEGGAGVRYSGDVRVVIAPSAMQAWRDAAGDALVEAIRGARSSIVVESPYFVLTPQMLEALERASARGVKIDVVTNSAVSTDNATSASLFVDTWPELLARVPTMRMFVKTARPTLHQKRVVLDDALVLVGSYNIDPFSAYVNSELMVAIWSREVNAVVRDQVDALVARGLDEGAYVEYRIARDDRRRPVRASDGRVVVEYGPADHVPPEELVLLGPRKDAVLALRELWEFDIVVW